MTFIWILVITLSALAALCIILIMPRIRRADMRGLVRDYAHRGLWDETHPENSLAAFSRAVNAGYAIELDVQLSSDKKIMVFHDYTLKRMCGVGGKLGERTFDELQTMRLSGSNERIPTLAQVLDLVGGRVPLLIELKGENMNKELCERVAQMLDGYRGRFCIESFNPILLSWFKKNRPQYARGQLVTYLGSNDGGRNPVVNFLLSSLMLNCLSRPDFIAVDGKIRNTVPIHICESLFGSRVFVWTVRSDSEYAACRKEGRSTIFEKITPELKG